MSDISTLQLLLHLNARSISMKFSLVIVSWNVKEDLVRCLRSIEENPPNEQFEIIVVDNASADGSLDAVRGNFPHVNVIANKENRGFAAANNQGTEKSQGKYLLFLNPDTIVHPGSLDILIKFMDYNKDVGACGPKLLNCDGTIQRSVRRFPTFRAALYQHTIFRPLAIFRGQYHKYMMKDFAYDCQKEVCQLMGAALLTRRSVINQVGNMDERFFIYYEEVDLCYRIKQAGWRIVFMPEAVVTHIGGQSTGQTPVRKRMMMLTSLLHYFRKHHCRFATELFICVFKPAIILKELCNIATGAVMYIFMLLILNERKRGKSAAKVKNSALFIGKYSWQLLFKT